MENITIQNRLTIIIPARNIDEFLEETIQKTRNLYNSVRIIVVLDEIDYDKKQKFDFNVTFLKSENHNMSAKRNQGVKAAETEFVGFIDSDSYPKDNWIENGLSYLDKHKDYAAVTGNQYLPPNDSFQSQCLVLVRYSRFFTYSRWFKIIDTTVPEQDCEEFMTSNVIMRKSVYEHFNGMDEDVYLAEDVEFSKRIIYNGYKIRFIPNVSVFHHERVLLPFMQKIFCLGYYYSHEFMCKKQQKLKQHYPLIFFPLIALIAICVYIILGFYFSFNIFLIFIFHFSILLLLLYQSFVQAQKLKTNKLKGLLFIFFAFILYCIFWISGTIAGVLKLPFINVKELYKQK